MTEPTCRLGLSVPRTIGVILYYPFFGLAFVLVWLSCLFDRLVPLPLPFPRHPAALAKRQAWCVDQLVKAGAIPAGAAVTRYEVRQFKSGEVFRSAVARVMIDYTHNGAPRSFACIAKFAIQGGSLGTIVISIFQRNARNEVEFYTNHGGSNGALRAYYARCSALAGNFLLLLEEVESVIEFTEEASAPIAQARDVVQMYARFHAAHWRPHAERHGKLPKTPVRIPEFAIDFMCSLALGRQRRVLRHLARQSWHHCNRPQTIVHGDARIGNVMFRADASGAPTRPLLIDWQSPHWGLATYDLAYFITLSLRPATRDAHEDELIHLYHAELGANGVTDYTFAAFHEDYLHALVLVGTILVVPLLGGEVTVNASNRERVISGGLVWYERLTHLIARFDTDWLAAHYGVDAASLSEATEWSTRHPPFLNRGACLVARELERLESLR